MYIPHLNKLSDEVAILEFMKRFSFATIVTSTNNIPVATHLPFVVTQNKEGIILQSHFAKANNQWQQLENAAPLVIFTEPHAYISPANYEKNLNVPTWNYIAVHCYGKASLITEEEKVMELLASTINEFEAGYKHQ